MEGPCKVTERGQQMLGTAQCTVQANFLESQSLQTSKLYAAFRLAQEQFAGSFMERISTAAEGIMEGVVFQEVGSTP